MRGLAWVAVVLLGAALAAPTSQAAALPEFRLTLQNHKFVPATLKVPANTQFKVLVTNHNPTPSEFESSDFNREKIVLPNTTITVFIGPLDKGSYKFFDDFDHATTGVLVAE
ncbi:MAG TPA: cupredoxin domain-containing protein [Rhodanobacteraceae bacterium]